MLLNQPGKKSPKVNEEIYVHLGFNVYDSTFYFSIAVVCIVGSGNDDEARIFGNKI